MRSAADIEAWLVARIAELLGADPAGLPVDVPFAALGLSSMQAVELSDDLQRWADTSLSPTFAYDHPSVAAAAAALAAELGGAAETAEQAAITADPGDAVAIVGIGCRFPGADGPREYWDLLRAGVDAITEVPADRWDAAALYDPDPDAPGRMTTKWGGFLDDVEHFDAEFFGIAAKEATRMDPQQRLLLEVAWHAIEDAGVGPGRLAGTSTGVFLGASSYDHGVAVLAPSTEVSAQDGTGSALSIVANRLSYCLNLAGASMVVDTACSSSLVAVHLACQSLRAGESEVALAGGVNVIAAPRVALSFSKGRLMAPDGRCKPFDERANGYVRSEGAGVVVLKTLARARRDGDRVYAVIRGGAVNQDGRTNGLIAPSRPAQERVLRAAYRAAGVDPARVAYVEAHGTGTAVGDPIEVGALAAVLGKGRDPEQPLRVGSAKSNLGHLEAAAGVAGLIKTALSLHHRELPSTIHYRRPNPLLELGRVPVAVQAVVEALPVDADGAAIAGTSSFGFGGTNAHVVLSTAPATEPDEPAGATDFVLFPVTARSAAGLRRRARGWARAAERNRDDSTWLARAAATAALRGDHDGHRAAVVARDIEELIDGLTALADGELVRGVCEPQAPSRRARRTALVFPGQGSQWDGMGRALAASVPAFAEAMRRCAAELERLLGVSLWSAERGVVAHGTAQVPPALFAMQVALAETWRSFGIEPAAVCGHSMGEIAAAHVSGALSLADAARIVCVRSALLTEISGRGGLALLELDAAQVDSALTEYRDRVSVAAVNGPRATVISGEPRALDEIVARLEADGVFARRIAVDFAAHSPAVEPLRPRLREAVRDIAVREPNVPLYSTVTGGPLTDMLVDPDYWARNLREPVLFDTAITALLAAEHDTFVEIAPHPVLARSLTEIAAESAPGADVVAVSSARRDEDEVFAFLHALGVLYTRGAELDWTRLYRPGTPVPIPSQGWNAQRFPLIRAESAAPPVAPVGGWLGRRVRIATRPELGVWPLQADAAPELADHVVDEVPVVPGAYWLGAAAQAARELADGDTPTVVLTNVAFEAPHVLLPGTAPSLQLVVESASGRSEFVIVSDAQGAPVTHARGRLDQAPAPLTDRPAPEIGELLARCAEPVPIAEFYERLAGNGLRYGPTFRGLTQLSRGGDEAVGKLTLPVQLTAGTGLHPALLDACLHTVAAAAGPRLTDALALPAGATRVQFATPAGPVTDVWCHARIVEYGERDLIADLVVLGADGRVLFSAMDFRITTAEASTAERGRLYRLAWQPWESEGGRAPRGGWLILGGTHPALDALAERLTARGDRVVRTEAHEAADYETAAAELAETIEGLRGVIDARAYSSAGEDPVESAAYTADAVELARFLIGRTWRETPRLWLLTPDTQRAVRPSRLSTASLWGVSRVIATEHPETACGVVDLPAAPSGADIDRLVTVLRDPRAPQQVSIDRAVLAPRLVPVPRARTSVTIDPDLCQVVTGGLGALGLRVADWLRARGARNLLLLGRSAPDAAAEQAVADLRASGVKVTVAAVDVADRAALSAALTEAGRIGGVFHLAGVLEDAVVADLDEARLTRALAGKARGAWHLHNLTLEQPLAHFVLFSSLAGLFGSPGQGAYAAANTYLDALAAARAAQGRPAQSIAWGPWAAIGLAAAVGSERRLAAMGVPALETEAAMDLLETALADSGPVLGAAAFDLPTLAGPGTPPAARELLANLLPDDEKLGSPTDQALPLHEIDDPGERLELVRGFVLGQVASIVGTSRPVDPTTPFRDLGFDSLMAVDLRNRLETGIGQRIPASLIFAHPTVDQLVEELAQRMLPTTEPVPETPPQRHARPDIDADLDQATDDELADLLSAELDLSTEGDTR
ncbi:type I polyketide synthase [Nocardia amikacinitolerans]|uniref:type I polyketide synthase n=1 Tax=Nocardia amikacinitolerans TaxID=756689 RepID=UPI0020A3094D|nr:type I polyketide synthase [Nocardia amikacinitolerans]MCP2288108.1 myxalamid-type polyketide synthase MxaE and MxaD [Nocardia amikacinitolerans]